MFTGIVEEIGVIKNIVNGEKSFSLTISCSKVLEDTKIGDSIATNGVCLTVTSIGKNDFSADVMCETIKRSSFKSIVIGSKVNLERAMKIGDRFGGHIVSGHIDGEGVIESFKKDENATWITIKTSNSILKYIIEKGSITIDGVSLTVVSINDEQKTFSVSIIPHTNNETILLTKSIGKTVNLENDIIGKYIERIGTYNHEKQDKKSNITMEFLSQTGFL